MEKQKHVVLQVLLDLAFFTAGSALFAVGMQMFIAPNQIAPGGVSAVAVVLNYLTGMPIGLWSLLLNIPILLLGLGFLGWRFTVKTMTAVVIMSVLTDAFYFVPVYQGDALLSALFGGLLMGAGMALIFMRDSTTGGVDILSRLIQMRLPYLPMGKLLLLIDVVIICFSALVFGKIETVLYSLVAVAVASYTIDSVMYGMDRGKLVYIFSPKSKEIARRVIDELDRGCTLLNATGGYSGDPQQALLVAVRLQQYHRLREIAHEEDSRAFIIVTDSSEVLGEGFKPITKQ